MELIIRRLQLNSGRVPFDHWLDSLDNRAQLIVTARLARLRAGNFGDYKHVGAKVFELRIDFGSGLRVYFARQGREIVVLLGGGDKRTQAADIKKAQTMWKEFENENSGLS